jgi:hypothetical protein
MNGTDAPLYYVWSLTAKEHRPLELPALISRIKSGEVQARSWVFCQAEDSWLRAAEVPELKMFFKTASAGEKAATGAPGLKPGALRRIKIFAEMDDAQLETFARCAEVVKFNAFSTVVQKGEHGDSMFLVLEGELRARTIIDGHESTLSTLGPGDFFGEVALLDHGPRSADILANHESVLLKISAAAIDRITRESPAAAAGFLLALGKALVGRTRKLTKRYEDTIHFSRAAASVPPGA